MRRSGPAAARGALAALLALLSIATACAALPWPHLPRSAASGERTSEGYLDLRGVTHVHTERSRDSRGRLADVVAAARSAGLDWVGFAEHRRRSARGERRLPSRVGALTLIPGWEVSASGGSLLLMGIRPRPPHFGSSGAAIAWAHERGGLAFAGHVERSTLLREPGAALLDGVEVANLHAELVARGGRFALAALVLPASAALRTLLHARTENIRAWEKLPGAPALTGGVDAHAKLRVLGSLGTLDRYVDAFRALTTHVHSQDREMSSILEALRAGRSYVAFEGLATVDRFELAAQGTHLRVRSPRAAHVQLICDGAVADQGVGEDLLLAPSPGARRCRAEVRVRGRLWIVSAHRILLPDS